MAASTYLAADGCPTMLGGAGKKLTLTWAPALTSTRCV